MIFGTVHRCKGMEYDSVTLLNDFITEKKLRKSVVQSAPGKMAAEERSFLNEEINILYIAVTRAKHKLILPPEINPLRSIEFMSQHPSGVSAEKEIMNGNYASWVIENERGEHPSAQFSKPDNQGKAWTEEEFGTLKELYNTKHPIEGIAKQLGRSEKSIRLKLYSTALIRVQDML